MVEALGTLSGQFKGWLIADTFMSFNVNQNNVLSRKEELVTD